MNAWLRGALLVAGALVALVLLGAGALFYLVSRLDVRAETERVVENATGRDLTIAGDVGVSFWPVLGLHGAQASLANVAGGRADMLLAVDDIHIGVELRPLLDRKVVVKELVLQHPRIALEVDALGHPNWLLAPAAAPAPRPAPNPTSTTPPATFTLQEVRISDGEVSYFDARRGAGWAIGDVDLTTALTALSEPMRIAGSVRYNDRPVEIEMNVANPGAAIAGRPTGLKLKLRAGLLSADFDGQTGAPGEITGAVTASGPSLRQLAAWSGSPINGGAGFEVFSVSGRLALGAGRYDFSNAGFTLDQIRGRGDFTLSQNQNKPYLSGRLELFELDLNSYLSGAAPAPATPQQEGAQPVAAAAPAAAPTAAPRAIDVARVASAAPIDFSSLRAINADLELTTAAVLAQHLRIDRAQLSLVVNDGYLAATLHNLALYGGSGRGRFEIDARQANVKISDEVMFQGVDTQRFLSDAINLPAIEGRGEVSLNLRSEGRTQQDMIAHLGGAVHLEVVSGALRGVDLGGVSRTIRNAVRGELIAPEARTPFHGFSATFAMADGVMATDNLSFTTPDLTIPGMALIDFNARRLDARLAPRSSGGGGIVVPFSARGPWTALAYDSDIRGRARAEIEPRVRAVLASVRARP